MGVVINRKSLTVYLSGCALFFLLSPTTWGQTGRSGGTGGTGGGLSTGGGSGSFGGGSGGFGGGMGQGGSGGFQAGGSGSNLGPQNFSTSPLTGASLGTTTAGGGSATGIPSTANLFRSYYGSPLAIGLSSGGTTAKSTATFGRPLYNVTSTSGSGTTSLSTTTTNGNGNGFSTFGMPRAPAYITALGEGLEVPTPPPTKRQADLQRVLERSSSLAAAKNIQVMVVENLVVLRGTVGTEKERRLAENLIRLTPGVQDVLNQVTVVGNKGKQ